MGSSANAKNRARAGRESPEHGPVVDDRAVCQGRRHDAHGAVAATRVAHRHLSKPEAHLVVDGIELGQVQDRLEVDVGLPQMP